MPVYPDVFPAKLAFFFEYSVRTILTFETFGFKVFKQFQPSFPFHCFYSFILYFYTSSLQCPYSCVRILLTLQENDLFILRCSWQAYSVSIFLPAPLEVSIMFFVVACCEQYWHFISPPKKCAQRSSQLLAYQPPNTEPSSACPARNNALLAW